MIDPRFLRPGIVVFDAQGSAYLVPVQPVQRVFATPVTFPFGPVQFPQAPVHVPVQQPQRQTPPRREPLPSAPVRFDMLGQVRGALSQALAANRAAVDGTDATDRRDTAESLASAILQTLGRSLPPIRWKPGPPQAYTEKGTIHAGDALAKELSLAGLTERLLYEAGNLHQKGAGASAALVLHALHREGFIAREDFERLMEEEDRTGCVYAALGAWIFDPAQRPPEREQPDAVVFLTRALDRAAQAGAFEQRLARYNGTAKPEREAWAFGDD